MSTTTKTRKTAARKTTPPRQQPAKAPEPLDDEPLSEQMAQDATPPRKPKGAPNLWPFQQLPRRRRAEFLRAFGRVRQSSAGLGEDASDDDETSQTDGPDQAPQTDDLELAAASYEMLADLQDALRIAAVEPEAYDAWADKATDRQLTDLSAWYMDRFQVGEA